MAATGGRLIKCVGGGCHGSVFLMLAILHSQKPQHYFAYHYMTGAIGVLTQSLGSLSASRLSRHSHILPGVFSGLCCLMAYSVILFLKKMDADTEEPSQDESCPLLSHQQQILRVDDAPASQMAVAGYISRPGSSGSPLRSQDLKFLPIVFVLMGFCKSTRPLFTTYIQHRHGVSPTEAEHLWLLRTVLSVALFVFAGLYTAYIKEPDYFNHVQAKIAILFISAGALAIGLPGSYNTITIGEIARLQYVDIAL
ncbi:hypothetical protein FOPG_17570 [Fusarium oxysporum f. sp. conglutinans race 2 54008]|nr:hypothetical protein FOPG_17570 [Fusarium oxysporum f. sp. conglutinans race 2 54008]